MSENPEQIVVYGTTWCPDCKRSKEFLDQQRIPYRWVDIEQSPEARAYVEKVNNGMRRVPTIVFPDGSRLIEPSNAELAAKVGIVTKAKRDEYDVIIIGAGAAGLTTAFYTAREGMETLVLDKSAPGGQAINTQFIENFPGFDEGISGEELARRLANQARRFGVEILQAQTVTDMQRSGERCEIITADGNRYRARAIVIATGARYRRLNVPGEAQLIGRSVHFCATCDGAFYKGRDVLVIGGGNSGFQEGLFLAKLARRVTIVEFQPQVRASAILQQKVAAQDNITVITNHAVQEFLVDGNRLAGVKVLDRASGEVKVWHPDGVFIFIGLQPNSDFLPPQIERNAGGFIVTDRTLQTSVKGIFAAGDVRAGAVAQLAAAAGEGATAALMVRQYLEEEAEGDRAACNTVA